MSGPYVCLGVLPYVATGILARYPLVHATPIASCLGWLRYMRAPNPVTASLRIARCKPASAASSQACMKLTHKLTRKKTFVQSH